MKLYLDIFFLVNACMNFIVLISECLLQKRKIRLGRIAATSLVGAAMSLGMVVGHIHTYKIVFFLLYFLAVFLLIYMAFGKTSWRAFLGNVIAFYVLSGILASAVMQLWNLAGQSGGILLLLLAGAFFLGALYRFLPFFHRRRGEYSRYYRVRLIYRERALCGIALLDTGNQLVEPFGHEPVSVGDGDFLAALFGDKEEPLFRYIPFHSLGNEGAMTKAFRLDAMLVEGDGKKQWRIEKPWMAIASNKLSADQEYQIILHPDMIGN